MTNPITTYGLTPVPASSSTLLTSYPGPPQHPTALSITALPIPSTPLATRINAYALSNLTQQTYNHSRRVYHYGLAIKNHRFPEWEFSDETYFCACMLHDIGAMEKNLTSTRLSFEFAGGILALKVLQDVNADGDVDVNSTTGLDGADADGDIDAEERMDKGQEIAPQDQAESIAEAIMRHQDLCSQGKITALGQLLQLATILDNTGAHESLIHPSTIEDIAKHFPRMKWSSCFVGTIKREISLKPWAHSTVLGEEEFPKKILGNTLMAPYE
ncbi:hypothetical protein SI65_02817 [Aspergillus cristatus]|uniref:HD/PDEase domain-containing protein n=1 Tax=Aspergillus cristatus TaxID=573508 RepID=A0A1E3BLX0_ASPCR|nr:hypothetical protein SI65_02817 [Aspergillus cristatus]